MDTVYYQYAASCKERCANLLAENTVLLFDIIGDNEEVTRDNCDSVLEACTLKLYGDLKRNEHMDSIHYNECISAACRDKLQSSMDTLVILCMFHSLSAIYVVTVSNKKMCIAGGCS
jgi:hypothetical protein